MRDGFDLAVIQTEGGFQQALAVAGGARARDIRLFRHPVHKLAHGCPRRFYRAAGIAGIEAVQQLAPVADEDDLRRGRTGIDAEIAFAFIRGKLSALHLRLRMPLDKFGILLLIGKKRRQVLKPEGQHHAILKALQQAVHRDGAVLTVGKG